MRTCATCKHDNEEPSRFCEQCGGSLEDGPAGALSRRCPVCERIAGPTSRFCTQCGHRFQQDDSVATANCPSCAVPISGDDTFCGSCGHRLSTSAELDETPIIGRPARGGSAPHLTVLAGREKDKIYSLSMSGIRIGRSRDNDVCLDTDGYVSTRHARIYSQGEEYFIEDTGSVNGTFVKLKKATRLENGDEIKVGQSLFRFEPS